MIRYTIEEGDLVGRDAGGDVRVRVPVDRSLKNEDIALEGLTIGEALRGLKDASSTLSGHDTQLSRERNELIKTYLLDSLSEISWELERYVSDYDGDQELRLVATEEVPFSVAQSMWIDEDGEFEYKEPALSGSPYIKLVEAHTDLVNQLKRLIKFIEEEELDVSFGPIYEDIITEAEAMKAMIGACEQHDADDPDIPDMVF